MASNRMRRIRKELDDIEADFTFQTPVQPAEHSGREEDISHLKAYIQGPPETPYDGGRFFIDIEFPEDYPLQPPAMKFETKIWHPNVDRVNEIQRIDRITEIEVDSYRDPWFNVRPFLTLTDGQAASKNSQDGMGIGNTEGLTGKSRPMKFSKIKRGLSGFINKSRVSAIADTGSAQNVISAAYASDLKLPIQHESSCFQLGNSKAVQSIGTVRLLWAFAEDPGKKYDLLFHVLPICIYDVILGSAFLTATETLSKYGRRLTECVFSVARVFKFGFLGNRCHRLEGILDGLLPVLAVPDTGAERNVMDAWYAKSHGFDINTGPGTQNVLQFADGSHQETIGQVTAYWTFASGKKAPLTFEVLEDCVSEVVIGEDFIFKHNIFAEHASSLRMIEFDCDSYELAPFDFISSWQKKYLEMKSKLQTNNNPESVTSPHNSQVSKETEMERLRRDAWNYKFDFGNKASLEERQAETRRREDYKTRITQHNPVQRESQTFRIPSIPGSPSEATHSSRAGTGNIPNFSRPYAR